MSSKAGTPSRLNGLLGVALVVGLLAIIAGVMLFKSCTALPSGTRATFSEKYSCPDDAITSKDRPDVLVSEFEKPATPPPDIAADPARLEVWRSNQPKPWPVDFFELRGCGHHVLWGCKLPSRSSSNGVHASCPYTRDLP